MSENRWAAGVDLGGTKIEVGQVDHAGNMLNRLRRKTQVDGGPEAVQREIISAVHELMSDTGSSPVGIGVGVAGQVEPDTGLVRFAPNLDWHDVALEAELADALQLPVVVTNDVRAITWGEWLHGAGQGCDDLICLFIGTGIGGGIVSGGRMLSGCNNTAGEMGHMTVYLHGPACHCGNHGCLEALAGGWAIARQAHDAILADPVAGAAMLKLVEDDVDAVTAEVVAQAAHAGDLLAQRLVDEVGETLAAGLVGLVNALNPCRLILGGGVVDGLPELLEIVDRGVRRYALSAATATLEIVSPKLQDDAGVIGAAALALRSFE
jgi:glucokinase